jgi:hypothetical protein
MKQARRAVELAELAEYRENLAAITNAHQRSERPPSPGTEIRPGVVVVAVHNYEVGIRLFLLRGVSSISLSYASMRVCAQSIDFCCVISVS